MFELEGGKRRRKKWQRGEGLWKLKEEHNRQRNISWWWYMRKQKLTKKKTTMRTGQKKNREMLANCPRVSSCNLSWNLCLFPYVCFLLLPPLLLFFFFFFFPFVRSSCRYFFTLSSFCFPLLPPLPLPPPTPFPHPTFFSSFFLVSLFLVFCVFFFVLRLFLYVVIVLLLCVLFLVVHMSLSAQWRPRRIILCGWCLIHVCNVWIYDLYHTRVHTVHTYITLARLRKFTDRFLYLEKKNVMIDTT